MIRKQTRETFFLLCDSLFALTILLRGKIDVFALWKWFLGSRSCSAKCQHQSCTVAVHMNHKIILGFPLTTRRRKNRQYWRKKLHAWGEFKTLKAQKKHKLKGNRRLEIFYLNLNDRETFLFAMKLFTSTLFVGDLCESKVKIFCMTSCFPAACQAP